MLYTYECLDCKRAYEVSRPVDERNKELLCTECGSKCRKTINSVPFSIKGFSEKNGYSNSVGDIVKRNGRYKSDEEGTQIE